MPDKYEDQKKRRPHATLVEKSRKRPLVQDSTGWQIGEALAPLKEYSMPGRVVDH